MHIREKERGRERKRERERERARAQTRDRARERESERDEAGVPKVEETNSHAGGEHAKHPAEVGQVRYGILLGDAEDYVPPFVVLPSHVGG